MRKKFLSHAGKPGCAALAAMGAILSACAGGSGEDLDVSGRPLSEGGNVALAPTLESIQANIFNPSCTVCHAGANAPQGLRLDAANSFTNLVGVPSNQVSLFRVNPGEPGQSYLVQKLEGSAAVGERMPLGGPPIPQATIDFVRQWISDGALADSGANDTTPVVVSFTPDPDSTVDGLPTQLVAGFNQEIDASTVNTLTVQMRRSGGDNTFDDGNEVAVAIPVVGLSNINPQLVIVDLSGVEPIDDRYQVTLKGTGPNLILDVNGVAIDGDFTGLLPSGDGVEGGDFVAEFELQRLQATMQSIQDNVFTPLCAGCHSGPAGPNLPSGQDLSSADASFANLVSVPSIQDPAIMRVAIDDANNSYLIQKLEGTATVGGRMPAGGPFLNQSTIDIVRRWIDQGANR